MVFDLADVPRRHEAYVFSLDAPKASHYPDGYVLGPKIYANPDAVQMVFRRLWVAPHIGELHVVRIARP
jgi:hypothetical protein